MTSPGPRPPARLHWLETLSGELPETTVAPDFPRLPRSRSGHETIHFELGGGAAQALSRLQRAGDHSIFSILAATVVLLLSKYVRGDELIVGTPSRLDSGASTMVPLKFACNRDDRCQILLAHVDEVIGRAFEHRQVDFCQLLSWLGIEASEDRCPLFDVALALEGYTHSLDLEAYPVDVAFAFESRSGGITCRVHFRSSLYETRKIERLAEHFASALAQLVSQPHRAIREIEILSAEEIEELVVSLNDNDVSFPLQRTFHGLFEEQVAATPDLTAATFRGQTLSYAALNARANQLAGALVRSGIRKGDFVAILQQRNCNFLTAMLAVFKAGGAYVPVDPSYPPDRIRYMLTDSRASYVITESDTFSELAGLLQEARDLRFVFSQEGRLESGTLGQRASELVVLAPEELAALSGENLGLPASGRDRAYMIYTSGSTGLPKGAICRHDGALNHLFGELHGLGIRETFSFLQSAASSSDISVWQFLGPLLYGGATHIVEHDTVVDPQALFRVIQDKRIDLVELVPVVLRALVDHLAGLGESERALPALRCMMATGDALPVDVVNAWFELYPSIPVANTYGPTEASDDVTLYVTNEPLPPTQSIVPIGRPLPNLSIFILDSVLRLAPLGVPGEICVSGVGVGEGYWNQPEKTAAVFVANSVSGARGETIYRTGDLGRWIQDGSIEFLGRLDQQVKIRGFRIEPGEVEAALLKHDAVGQTVVMTRTDRAGNKGLVAYVVPEAGASVSTAELRDFLAGTLPDYMVPAVFVTLDAMPLTPIGKIDRKALPDIEDVEHQRSESYVEPRTPTELAMAEIWADLLGLPEVGANDNFVELGGDSILGIHVAMRAKDAGFPIRPKQVFQYPTVATLAKAADALAAASSSAEVASREPLVDQDLRERVPFPLARIDAERVQMLRDRYPGVEDLYPLSPTQLGLYLQWALSAKGSGVYVEQIGLTLPGHLYVDALEAAWRWVIRRTPVLRTCFTRRGLATPLQVVVRDAPLELRRLDWRERDSSERDSDLDVLALAERAQGFDLARAPLMRTIVVRLEDGLYRMLWSYHHIVLDGWSEPLVLGRVFRAYTAFREGREPDEEPSPPYRDFISWVEQQDWEEAETYWRRTLSGFTEPNRIVPLPSQTENESGTVSHGWCEYPLSREKTGALEDTARRWRLTLNTVLQGAWTLFLYQLTGHRDVLFGTATSGRQGDLAGVHLIPGLFIATLPVRVHVTGNATVRSWLTLLQTQIVEMRQHEHFGHRRIQSVSGVAAEKLPLFDSIFIMANHPKGQLVDQLGPDLGVSAVQYTTMPHYPLTLFVVVGETLAVRLVYSRQRFGREAISRFLGHYVTLLDCLCADPRQDLDSLISRQPAPWAEGNI